MCWGECDHCGGACGCIAVEDGDEQVREAIVAMEVERAELEADARYRIWSRERDIEEAERTSRRSTGTGGKR